MSDKAKITKTANIVLRVVLFVVTYGFIFQQVFLHKEWKGVWLALSEMFSKPSLVLELAGILILMAVNWGIEALKWRFMIGKIEKVTFGRSCQAVMAGVSISSFTPNRIGEFFGRVFILDKGSHVEGILISILGSMSQLLITILTGSIALLFFIPSYFPAFNGSSGLLFWGLVVLVISLNLLLILLYFNVSLLTFIREKWLKSEKFRKIRRFFDVFSYYNARELATVLLLSFCRYAVFSCQYFLLLRIFHVPVPLKEAMIFIPLVFFIQTVVPSSVMTDLGVRGSTALYIFGLFLAKNGMVSDAHNLGILISATVLWIINLAIPAVMGTFFLFRLKFFRKDPAAANNS